MSKFFTSFVALLSGQDLVVAPAPVNRKERRTKAVKTVDQAKAEEAVANVPPKAVRQKAIAAKLAAQRAEEKAKADALKAQAEAEAAELKRLADTPVYVFRDAAISAAAGESRALVEYARKLGVLFGPDFWRIDASDKGIKSLTGNEKARAEPIAAERRTFIEGLKNEGYNSKGYTYWSRVLEYAKRFDPNAPKGNDKAQKTLQEATRIGLETAWVRLNKHEDYLDPTKNEKLLEINKLLEAALLLTGVRSIAALRAKKEI